MKVIDAKRLGRERTRSRYSQTDLANLVGVKQQFISGLETGAERSCTKRVADRICRYLGCELEDVFEAEDALNSSPCTSSRAVTGSRRKSRSGSKGGAAA